MQSNKFIPLHTFIINCHYMELKKIISNSLKVLLILLIIVLAYFVYLVVWTYQFHANQDKIVENVDSVFYQTSQIIRDPNGYFGVAATVNGLYTDTLLFDTQASTSLAKQETLDLYGAEYWRRKPMPTFNFYKQVYFSKLYRVNNITLGDCTLEKVIFTSVPKDNGMYNALYRPVLGRTIMENMVWKFDMDNNEMTIFSLKNKEKLKQETTGFTLVEDGVNNLPLCSEQTDSLNLMLDLGSNYDVIIDKDVYECLARKQKRLKIGTKLIFSDELTGTVIELKEEGITHIKFDYDGVFLEIISKIGAMPLPPYIHEKLKDKDRYNTVYSKINGSAAAPTAGLHFTNELLEEIENKGIEVLYVTLHVGLGTFRPVNVEDVTKRVMHSEEYEITEEVAYKLNKAKDEKRRIVCVGTTSVRTL